MRRHVRDVWTDVCISDVWARDVFGTSVFGLTPDVDETSCPRRLDRCLYFGRLGTRCISDVCFRSHTQTSMRRHVPDVLADVCISDVWARDVFGTSVFGPTLDVAETSCPRRLGRHLYFGRLATGCIWDVWFRSHFIRRWDVRSKTSNQTFPQTSVFQTSGGICAMYLCDVFVLLFLECSTSKCFLLKACLDLSYVSNDLFSSRVLSSFKNVRAVESTFHYLLQLGIEPVLKL